MNYWLLTWNPNRWAWDGVRRFKIEQIMAEELIQVLEAGTW